MSRLFPLHADASIRHSAQQARVMIHRRVRACGTWDGAKGGCGLGACGRIGGPLVARIKRQTASACPRSRHTKDTKSADCDIGRTAKYFAMLREQHSA